MWSFDECSGAFEGLGSRWIYGLAYKIRIEILVILEHFSGLILNRYCNNIPFYV